MVMMVVIVAAWRHDIDARAVIAMVVMVMVVAVVMMVVMMIILSHLYGGPRRLDG